ncbi:MAG: flagellar hook-length control protein FliK [Gammaproteobacteria bacterium]|nr:flagellar hook-length control protein FliK [Gammaproteobacteria bacterium]
MEISNSITGYRISLERIRNTLLESLRVGQILQARALTSTQNSQVRLRIGKLDILARTQAGISAGDNLTLQVIKAANPLQLKLIQEISSHQLQTEAMRVALPQQTPVSHLIKQLIALTPAPPGGQPGLPPTRQPTPVSQPLPLPTAMDRAATEAKPAGAATADTLRSLPSTQSAGSRLQSAIANLLPGEDAARLSQTVGRILNLQILPGENPIAENIRLAFARSGLFLESALATGSAPPDDMKRSILELLLQLRPLLAAAQSAHQPVSSQAIERGFDPVGFFTELVSHAEGSLARILFNQLSSLPGDNANQQIWQFELPYRHNESCDSFRVQIERETKQGKKGIQETLWSVGLDFELEPIGPIHARLVLTGEEISSRFTAEYAETARLLEEALPHLANAFSRAGLKVGTLSAVRGTTENAPRPRFPLLDERA